MKTKTLTGYLIVLDSVKMSATSVVLESLDKEPEFAIGKFIEWAVKKFGFRPWEDWHRRGCRVRRVIITVEGEEEE